MASRSRDYQTKDLGEACSLMVSNQPIRAIHWKDAIAYLALR